MPVSQELLEHYHSTRFDVEGLDSLQFGSVLPGSFSNDV
jgi:hypothetical protein